MLKHILLLLAVILLYCRSEAQYGNPFIRNISPKKYHAHEDNFDIAQDSSGMMYFANFAALLSFNGEDWSKTAITGGMRVLAVEESPQGTIYLSGAGDFGYLKKDQFGNLKYKSLRDSGKLDFSEVFFEILCSEDMLYIVSEEKLYYKTYSDSVFSVLNFPAAVNAAFLIKDKLFVFPEENNDRNFTHLQEFDQGKFKRAKYGKYTELLSVSGAVEMDGTFYLYSENQDFAEYSGGSFQFKKTVFDKIIENRTITEILKLQNGNYLFGSRYSGIFVADKKGDILYRLNTETGFPDNHVRTVYEDMQGGVWAATASGISKIDLQLPFKYADRHNSGLSGKLMNIAAADSILYIASDDGLYRSSKNNFRKIKGFPSACNDITVFGKNKIAAATFKGIYFVENGRARQSSIKDFSLCIEASDEHKGRFYSGHNGFIYVFEIKNNELTNQKKILTASGDVSEIKELDDKTLYVEIQPNIVIHINTETGEIIPLKTDENFVSAHLNRKGTEVFIATESGLYLHRKQDFESFSLYNKSDTGLWIYDFFQLNPMLSAFTDGEQKNLSLYKKNDEGNYFIDQRPFLPVKDFSVNSAVQLPNGNIVFGGKSGLLLYETDKGINFKQAELIISEIRILAGDSVLSDLPENKPSVFKSEHNSLKFKCAYPSLPAVGENEYRFYLEGFQSDTSDWTSLNTKEFTNLPGGDYTLLIQVRNRFHQIVSEKRFAFSVEVPIYLRWWIFIIYAAILFFGIKLLLNYRMKKAAKERETLENIVRERTEEIERAKEEIESQRDQAFRQRKEIMDSINYARRIQQAVLPSKEQAEELLGEHFILYLPRDVVSGDFYWIKKLKNFVAVVAADCTGHGVPGAFMSMLGSSFLNEIVTRRSLDGAHETLNRLRKKVKKSLGQTGADGEQKDGMDIAFYFLDTETLELQFSGAYNPLYIIRKQENDEYKVIRLKADRQPIGIHIREKEFTNHRFQLQKGDTLYTFSDGYPDQFGGETGGKFKSKRFKELLTDIQERSMQEQKEILEQNFIKWRGEIEQVDDVLVIGLRV